METFKYIVLIENFMGVYRNFSQLGKYQNLVFYRILFEISGQIASLVFYIKCSDNISVEKFYYTISQLSSIFIICVSVYHSKGFSKLTKQHNDFNTYFPTDNVYKRKLKSRNKVVYYSLLVFNLYCFSSYFMYYFQLSVDKVFICTSISLYYLLELTAYLSDCRFIIEVPIISVFYMAMSDQLDTISRSLKAEINGLKRFKVKHRFDDIYYSRFSKGLIFDNWSAAYAIVEKNSKLCKNVFGFQITTLVVVIIIYYVSLLSGMVTLSVMGDFTPLMQFMYMFSLFEFLACLCILSRAAQRANGSANAMRRQLCTLLVHSLGCKMQYKATRDFLRLVRTHPIQTRAFGSIDVGMTLLPTCIAFCTSYTVIALQFNNIL